jgi:hypothetical protein
MQCLIHDSDTLTSDLRIIFTIYIPPPFYLDYFPSLIGGKHGLYIVAQINSNDVRQKLIRITQCAAYEPSKGSQAHNINDGCRRQYTATSTYSTHPMIASMASQVFHSLNVFKANLDSSWLRNRK